MHLKSDLVYDKHTGELIGFTNLGEMNMHLLNLEKSLDHCTPEEPQNLCWYLWLGGYFLPYNIHMQFPCANLSGDLIFDIFWEAVEHLEKCVYVLSLNYCEGWMLKC